MAYSLGIRCVAEFLGMIIVIYTGEAALANELLPSTKGHAMGWGWTVFTFGFAFLAPLQIFSKVSAKLNPAMCLAQWVWGNLTGVDFVCLSLAELAGAFVGAVLHWIHFLPHYKTLPEPPAERAEDTLLRRRDEYGQSALCIASYATKPDRKVVANPLDPLRNTLYYLNPCVIHEETPSEVVAEYYAASDPLRRHSGLLGAHQRPQQGGGKANHPLARKTIQVADLHHFLQDAHVERVLQHRTCPKCTSSGAPSEACGADQGWEDGAAKRQHSAPDNQLVVDMPGTPSKGRRGGKGGQLEAAFGQEAVEREAARAHALYQAAVVADQNAKLSIFATRPAIYAPLYNFITETMGTTALLLLVLLVELQARRFDNEDFKLFYEVAIQNLIICFVVVILISGLGGPTAYAANPARDLGPRIAHAVLPIPGKGSSEWQYAWIPVFAPLCGGALAGALYIAIEEMQFPGNGSRGGGLFVG